MKITIEDIGDTRPAELAVVIASLLEKWGISPKLECSYPKAMLEQLEHLKGQPVTIHIAEQTTAQVLAELDRVPDHTTTLRAYAIDFATGTLTSRGNREDIELRMGGQPGSGNWVVGVTPSAWFCADPHQAKSLGGYHVPSLGHCDDDNIAYASGQILKFIMHSPDFEPEHELWREKYAERCRYINDVRKRLFDIAVPDGRGSS